MSDARINGRFGKYRIAHTEEMVSRLRGQGLEISIIAKRASLSPHYVSEIIRRLRERDRGMGIGR